MNDILSEPNNKPETKFDPKSRYYSAGNIETLDVIKAKLTSEQYQGYLLGNALKYQCRMNFKGVSDKDKLRDAEKAANYTAWLRDAMMKSGITIGQKLHAAIGNYNQSKSPCDDIISMVICLKCYTRWIALRSTTTRLIDLECSNCGQGYVIETGQIINEE